MGNRFTQNAVAWIIFTALLLGATSLLYPRTSLDSPTFTYVARTILEGGSAYRDAWDVKGPMIHYVYALVLFLFGVDPIGLRLMDLLWQLATALTLLAAARRVWPDPRVPPLAGITYLLLYYSHKYWAYAQPDGFLSLPLALSFFCVLRAWEDGRLRWWFLAAACTGVAAGFKLPMGLFGLLLLWAAGGPREHGWGKFAQRWVALATGVAAPVALFCAFLYLRGGLPDFLVSQFVVAPQYTAYWRSTFTWQCLRQNLTYFGHIPTFVLSLLVAGFAIRTAARKEKLTPAQEFVFAWWGVGLITLVVHSAFLPYHFLPLAAPLSILAAGSIFFLAEAHQRLAVLGLLALALVVPANEMRHRAVYSWSAIRHPETLVVWRDLGDYLREHTAPSEPLYVWGNVPEIYILAERKAATRFSYALFLAKDWDGVDLRALFLSEFKSNLPRYFVLIKRQPPLACAAATRSDEWESFQRFAALKSIVEGNYQLEMEGELYLVYRRADRPPQGKTASPISSRIQIAPAGC
jgi:4-amino-4-deoxy-L-arabinose transferase-like glycosyltransferase